MYRTEKGLKDRGVYRTEKELKDRGVYRTEKGLRIEACTGQRRN